ncbi:MAG TPA: serine/threonine-protein kinase, partial [Phycisphaerae bacterium]
MLGAGDDALPFAELAEDLRGARDALSTKPITSPPSQGGVGGGCALSTEGEREDASRPSGSCIGPYHLLEKLGEGGFGVVYVAEQEQPVRRRVALKVIKLGMDTRQVVARFEAERQALAMMDHPHIAKVFDAGATDSGRPYFVMELVRGIPITHYCDQNKLSPRERLELFIPICQAVQHAHTKAVIHRDLKPSNVLVTLHDGEPVPKVIDFGIAKATAGRLTDKTIYTEFHAMIGTPAYMSPEQAELSGLDIDTRSDIYALGVLLYELLTGTTPFDATDLMRSGLAEMQRIIREVQPPKPSTRISSLGLSPSPFKGEGRGEGGSSILDIAKHRRTDPQSLAKTIRGDLDWIVMKCLEKDRTRRYETASALAADAQRYLTGEPVLAAPPSRWYRLRKVLRRHRRVVLPGAVLVLMAIVGLSIGTLLVWQEQRRTRAAYDQSRTNEMKAVAEAERADREARDARAQAAKAARAARRAEATNKFIQDMLSAADPSKLKGADVTVRSVLDAAVAELDAGSLAGEPETEGDVRTALGQSYQSLAMYEIAGMQLSKALELYESVFGPEQEQVATGQTNLADLLRVAGKLDEAESAARRSVAIKEKVFGGEENASLALSVNNLASV